MRKTVTALFLMLIFCASCARADNVVLQTETGANGAVVFPVFEPERVNEELQTRLGVSDALILLQSGAEIAGSTALYSFDGPNGEKLASVCFTQQGKIRFGRYGQVPNAVLVNTAPGEAFAFELLLNDTAQMVLDAYVEEQVTPHLNTYLDAADLLPVPLENVSLSAQGITVHYPSDRFSFFSGNSGAIEIKYHEIAEAFTDEAADALLPKPVTGQEILLAAAEGSLYGLPELRVDEALHGLLQMHGTLTEPDYIADGEMYELEAPAYRSVQLLAARGAEEDDAALLTGVRSSRLNLGGLITGQSDRDVCLAILGAPQSSVQLDADAAENYRVTEGWMDSYAAGDYTLRLYFDLNDILTAVEIGR